MLALMIGALAVTVAAAASLIISTLRLGSPPMPTSQAARRAVLTAIAAYPHLTSVVELGSGWGGLSRQIACTYPATMVTGIERSWVPWLVSRVAAGCGVKHPRRDCLTERLTDAAVYIAYLSPNHMRRLRDQFERDRPRGGVLISVAFAMPGWTPAQTLTAPDLYRTQVYIYEY
jgi:hypothetical protein